MIQEELKIISYSLYLYVSMTLLKFLYKFVMTDEPKKREVETQTY